MGKSNYSDDIRQQLDAVSRRVAGELQTLNDSGATTTDDRQRAYDAFVANLPDDDRARFVEEAADAREQIEAMLTDSGYKGDLGSTNLIDLANLAATRGLLTLEGTASIPTASALDAAAAAAKAGGSFHLNPMTGGIWIYRDANLTKLHDYLPGGTEGPPAAVVSDEVVSDSERGGVRPTIAQSNEALRDGAETLSYGPGGEVIGHFPDGSSRSYPHDQWQQGLEDLQHADGRIADVGEAIDDTLTRAGDDFFRGIQGAIDDMSRTRYDSITGSGAAAGMGGTSTTPGMTGGGGGGAGTGGTSTGSSGSSSQPGTTPGATSPGGWDSTLEPDVFDALPTTNSGGKPSSGTETTPETPGSTEPNEIVDRSDYDEPVQPDDDDGYRPSTTPPPTDGTYVDTDKDGIPDEEEEDEEDEEDPPATDTEYTPAPDGENRTLTQEDLDRMAELAAAREGWKDGTAVRPAEYDPAFAARLQDRKLGMIGNPGDPKQDMGPVDGELPETRPGEFDGPDDDTGNVGGHDLGHEDEMLNQPQGTLDPSILDDQTTAPLAPQEMVIAELDPSLVRPLEVAIHAEVNLEGTPEIAGYGYALGDPVSAAPPPEDEPSSIMAAIDPRVVSHVSIPEAFRVAPREADEDEPDAG